MSGIEIVALIVAAILLYLWLSERTGIPALIAAYPAEQKPVVQQLGSYLVFRGFGWLIFGCWGLVEFRASSQGLRISGVVPPIRGYAFVPWDEVWIRDNGKGARVQLGFSRCPDFGWAIARSFILKARRTQGVNIPAECFV